MPLSGDSFCLRTDNGDTWTSLYECGQTHSPVHARATFIFPGSFHPAPHVDIHFILLHMWWSISLYPTELLQQPAVQWREQKRKPYCRWGTYIIILVELSFLILKVQACTKDLWFSFYWEMIIVVNFDAKIHIHSCILLLHTCTSSVTVTPQHIAFHSRWRSVAHTPDC